MKEVWLIQKLIKKVIQIIKKHLLVESDKSKEWESCNSRVYKVKCMRKNGKTKLVASNFLKKGDIIEVTAGEIIPCHGEIIEGIATVDESVITGESAFTLREAEGEASRVTAGTKVICNTIKIKVLFPNKGDNKQEDIQQNKSVSSINDINLEV